VHGTVTTQHLLPDTPVSGLRDNKQSAEDRKINGTPDNQNAGMGKPMLTPHPFV
jgi:hypothetical protein